MCVALPARIVSIDTATAIATATIGTVERTINLAMTPEVAVGDWVISHSGFAVRRITADDAAVIHELLESAPLESAPRE